MNLREALIQQAPSLALQRAAADEIAKLDARIRELEVAGAQISESAAARDVLAERQRQISVEGWTPERDDQHTNCGIALVAAAYAVSSVEQPSSLELAAALFRFSGWAKHWFKPRTPREDLVRAGALILAEIERLDRAAQRKGQS